MAVFATTRRGRALLRRSARLRGIGDDSGGIDWTSVLNNVVQAGGAIGRAALQPGVPYGPSAQGTQGAIGGGISSSTMQYGILAVAAIVAVSVASRR
jgi:hypothetical protein